MASTSPHPESGPEPSDAPAAAPVTKPSQDVSPKRKSGPPPTTRLRHDTLDAAMQGFVFVVAGESGFFSRRSTREYAILQRPRTTTGLGAVLEFYPTSSNFSSPTKVLSMSSLLKVEEVWGTHKKRHTFKLWAVGQRLEISCKIRQERDMWVNAIRRLMTTSKKDEDRAETPTAEHSKEVYLCHIQDTLLSQRLEISGKECVLDLCGNDIKLIGSAGELERWDAEEVVHVELQNVDGLGEMLLFVLKSHSSERMHSVEVLQLRHNSASQILPVVMLQLQTRACMKKAVVMRQREVRASLRRQSQQRLSAGSTVSTGSECGSTVFDVSNESEQSSSFLAGHGTFDSATTPRSFSGARPKLRSSRSLESSEVSLTPFIRNSFKSRLLSISRAEETTTVVAGDNYHIILSNQSITVVDKATSAPMMSWLLSNVVIKMNDPCSVSVHEAGENGNEFVFEVEGAQQLLERLAIAHNTIEESSQEVEEDLTSDVGRPLIAIHILASSSTVESDLQGEWQCRFTDTEVDLLDIHTLKVEHSWSYGQIATYDVDDSCEILTLTMIYENDGGLRIASQNVLLLVELLDEHICRASFDDDMPQASASDVAAHSDQEPPSTQVSASSQTTDRGTPEAMQGKRRACMYDMDDDIYTVPNVSPLRQMSEDGPTLSITERRKKSRSRSLAVTPGLAQRSLSDDSADVAEFFPPTGAKKAERGTPTPPAAAATDSAFSHVVVDFVPTLVHQLCLDMSTIIDHTNDEEMERPLEPVAESQRSLSHSQESLLDAAGASPGSADTSSVVSESSSLDAEAEAPSVLSAKDVTPYAVFATYSHGVEEQQDEPLYATGYATAGYTTPGYAAAMEGWSSRPQEHPAGQRDPGYIEPNCMSQDRLEGLRMTTGDVLLLNESTPHIYLDVVDGRNRQPAPLPRSEQPLSPSETTSTYSLFEPPPTSPRTKSADTTPTASPRIRRQQDPGAWETSVSMVGSHLAAASAYVLKTALTPVPTGHADTFYGNTSGASTSTSTTTATGSGRPAKKLPEKPKPPTSAATLAVSPPARSTLAVSSPARSTLAVSPPARPKSKSMSNIADGPKAPPKRPPEPSEKSKAIAASKSMKPLVAAKPIPIPGDKKKQISELAALAATKARSGKS